MDGLFGCYCNDHHQIWMRTEPLDQCERRGHCEDGRLWITTALMIKIRMTNLVKIKMIKKIVDYDNYDDQTDCGEEPIWL